MDQATTNGWLGIDVSKEKVDSALLVDQRSGYRVFANTPGGFEHLSAWLRQEHIQHVHACLEATGSYSDAAFALSGGAGPYGQRAQSGGAAHVSAEPQYPQ